MHRRRRTIAVVLTSATAATLGLHHYIHHSDSLLHPHHDENSLKLLETKFNLTDDLLKNHGENSYIPADSVDAITATRYRQASHYLKQIRSNNVHIRERGLAHLARLNHLPATYFSIIGQQLDFHSAIQLARTAEADIHLFPSGPPYILPVSNRKTTATDNVHKLNDDEILLFTIREFLKKLKNDEKRPLDILSQHYLKLLISYLDDVESQTVFDLVQHFEPEHADMSSKAIKRYRSNLELYSTFLYALRGYADRYPLEVIHHNGLQILKYLYEKRKTNVPFIRFIGKILILLSRDQRTHESFYAVGWVRILHEMVLDKENIIYSLLAATILANLDRSVSHEKISTSEPKITLPIQPLQLPSEISPVEIVEAEQKTEEKKEIVQEQSTTKKSSTMFGKLLERVWYKRPVSDEGDIPDETDLQQAGTGDKTKKLTAPDIDTSHATETESNVKEIPAPTPTWINEQVYGDKVILLSPALYNIRQIDADVRWHQEPLVDVIFFHGLAGSAFKTWRQESEEAEEKVKVKESLVPHGVASTTLSATDETSEDETDELPDIGEESRWEQTKDFDSSSSKVRFDQDNSRSLCWPKDWLSEDVPTSHIRILAVDYESRVSEWQARSMPRNVLRRSMHDRAQEIAEQLKQAGVGKRPVIWVAHSMGGLLTKYILSNEENEILRSNTRGCVFFSVPHFGAELASFGIRHAFIVRPTVEIEELQPNSEHLLQLHERFLDVLKSHNNIRILSFAENEKTTFSLRYQTVVVPSESSQINIGKFFVLNKNHIFICKPKSKYTIEYQELLDLIQTIYEERKNELKSEQIRTTEEFLNNLYMFSSPIEDDMQ